MKRHELKTWPEFFEAMWDGRKTFDVRFDDRGFEVGDQLCLKEWRPEHEVRVLPEDQRYTGRELFCTVSYIVRSRDVASLGLISAGCAVLGVSVQSRWEEVALGG